jgi:hypothetical protein
MKFLATSALPQRLGGAEDVSRSAKNGERRHALRRWHGRLNKLR